VNKLKPHATARRGIPAHWQRTVMPEAGWYWLQADRLRAVQGDGALELNAALRGELERAAPGATVIASDRDEVIWRLRKIDSVPVGNDALWQAQTLVESRSRLFCDLRGRLASRLSSQLLHDLRNPVNALSLHADLLARLVAMPEAEDRATASLRVIRERIGELTRRQDALVSLWLAPPACGADASMQRLVENAVRLARGFGALHDIHLRVGALDRLANCRPPRIVAHVEVAMIALLLACESALLTESGVTRELAVEAVGDDRPDLIIRASICGSADVIVDELQLLLDDEPLTLCEEDGAAVLRFDPMDSAGRARQ